MATFQDGDRFDLRRRYGREVRGAGDRAAQRSPVQEHENLVGRAPSNAHRLRAGGPATGDDQAGAPLEHFGRRLRTAALDLGARDEDRARNVAPLRLGADLSYRQGSRRQLHGEPGPLAVSDIQLPEHGSVAEPAESNRVTLGLETVDSELAAAVAEPRQIGPQHFDQDVLDRLAGRRVHDLPRELAGELSARRLKGGQRQEEDCREEGRHSRVSERH